MDDVGAKVRLRDLFGNDLGTAHVPLPLDLGDVIATHLTELIVVGIDEADSEEAVAALCIVKPLRLRFGGALAGT